jgi:hypothetical protein
MIDPIPTFSLPFQCAFCGQPFAIFRDREQVAAWRSTTGKLYCSEFCADDEEEANLRRKIA